MWRGGVRCAGASRDGHICQRWVAIHCNMAWEPDVMTVGGNGGGAGREGVVDGSKVKVMEEGKKEGNGH